MSFYGNILNRLDKFWRTIRVKTGSNTYSEMESDENDVITLTSSNGIVLTTNDAEKSINVKGPNNFAKFQGDNNTVTITPDTSYQDTLKILGTNGIQTSGDADEDKITIDGAGLVKNAAISGGSASVDNHTIQTITLTKTMGNGGNSQSQAYVHIPKLNITRQTDNSDGLLTYKFQYGNEVKTIDIPLDLILDSSEVIIKNSSFTGEDEKIYSAGTYLHLVFKTSEQTSKHCYINVTSLNEIAGNATATITVTVDENQKITAEVRNGSIDTDHLADDAITEDKIADGAVTLKKIADGALMSNNVRFTDDLITTYDIGNVKIENGQATIAAEGKTLNEVWQTIFVKEINTSLQNTAPSCSMSGNSVKYYLVGATSEAQTITLGLSKGSYDYGYGYVESKDETDPAAGTPAKTRVTNDGTGVVAVASNPYTLTWDGTSVTPTATNGNVFSCAGIKKTSAPVQAQVVGKVKYEKAGNPVSNLGNIYPAQAYTDTTSAANTQTLARWYYPFYQGFTVDSDVIADPASITATQLEALNAANMTTYRFSDDAASVKDSDRPGTTKFVDANAYNKKKITKATAANAWRQYFLAYPKEYSFDMSAVKDGNSIDCTVRQAADVIFTFNGVEVVYAVYYINNAAAYNTKTISWTLN